MNRHRARGFSLIELLAAIAILSIIVLAMSRIFGDSSKIWKLGNKKLESNVTGRNAIELMARELAGAMISRPGVNGPSLKLDSDIDSYLGLSSDRLSFVSLSPNGNPADYIRDFQQVHYRVIPSNTKPNHYNLVVHYLRVRNNNDFDSPTNSYWWSDFWNKNLSATNSGTLAENVRNFEVFIADQSGTPRANYDTRIHGPPLYIDIYLEVLASDDAAKAAVLGAADPYVNRATRRYQTRVYLANRRGYASL